jgi:hypothetical protein
LFWALPFHDSHWINTMYRCVLAAAAAVCLVAPAAAQQRVFPQTALRGALLLSSPTEATLNGKPVRLAPGLRIRAQDNMLVMSGSVLGTPLAVNYTMDTYGLVKDVWILTPAEAARKPWPTSAEEAQAWTFDPVAQTWSRP